MRSMAKLQKEDSKKLDAAADSSSENESNDDQAEEEADRRHRELIDSLKNADPLEDPLFKSIVNMAEKTTPFQTQKGLHIKAIRDACTRNWQKPIHDDFSLIVEDHGRVPIDDQSNVQKDKREDQTKEK